uniref:Caffeoyl-CoA O-methyltransferase n=1 Tax=uncultured bacterium esnapd2 TaxID=1366601 RepID=S5UBR2_9BACT|nr:caffeoyl-CoA O-methyltransferase [uncultured bacterium esnapd2]
MDDVERDLAATTRQVYPEYSGMQVTPLQAALLSMLARTLQPRFAVEVGTFTGYSAMAIAKGLPRRGRLLCCEASSAAIAVARPFWQRAGVADRITVKLGRALDTLRELPRRRMIDLAFVDADKNEYVQYWTEIVPRTRAGGLIVVDNVFGFGGVVDDDLSNTSGSALREFNEHVLADGRVERVVLPIGDGLTIARRK